MAAGLGFKTFAVGEVLTAADTNGYLMQGVLVFADSTARDAAITSPQEGQFAYLKDTNVTTYYTGSAWANLDTTGMTNPMTTTGDMVYSSSGSTPARLGIGSTGQVLTVAAGIPSWGSAPSSSAANASALTTGSQTTTSGSYTGLTTATAVTVTTGTKALVIITTEMSHSTNSEQLWASWAVSGATTSASADSRSVFLETPSTGTLPRVQTFTRGYIQTGLTAGSNTFTMQFKVGGGTGVFGNRSISVVDMGS